jgi:outer membrane receptor protein involved in Fe transport
MATHGSKRAFGGRTALSAPTLAAAILWFGQAGIAWAQEAQPGTSSQESAAEGHAAPAAGEIVVTGSRVARSGFSTPTPVTVVGSQRIEARGAANVAAVLNELPAFRGSSTPSANTQIALTAGQNFADLRGLGANRTLVLVDGKRFVPVNPTGQVDLNLIPSGLIERVEVVTGGASAAYGSDAVAGVVNLIFKKDLNGLQAEIQNGVTEHGDNRESKASLIAGTSFAGGRGHIMVAGEYAKATGIRRQSSREWGAKGYHLIANPAFAPGNGQPRQIIAADAQLTYATFGGLINSGPLTGTAFLPNGQTTQIRYGPALAGSSYMVGGTGINPDLEKPLAYPVERAVAFARPSFDLTDDITVHADLSYGHSVGGGELGGGTQTSLTVQQDNAFLPDTVRQRMIAAGLPSFTFGKITRDIPLRTEVTTDTYRGVLGIDGKIGPDWTWNAYFERGYTRYQDLFFANTIRANLTNALDAVRNPANGQIVCRSTLTAPGNGCVPINLFGDGSPTPEAIAYATGTQKVVTKLNERVLAASVSGSPFSTWAGPVSVAVGAERRWNRSVQVSDPIAQARGYAISNPQPYSGRIKVTEAFGEVVLPLAENLPLLRSLELNAAGRYTDYSTSGSVETWKVGASWKPVDSLRLRGTISRDIRAPNIAELFSPAALLFFTATDPANGGRQIFTQQLTSGNPDLVPEKADTKTFGAIYSPEWLPGLTLSLDYYDIRIKGAIATLSAQQIVDRCFTGQAVLCPLVSRDAAGQLTGVAVRQVNLALVRMRGLDFEARYRLPLDRLSQGISGVVDMTGLVSYLDSFTQSDGVTTFQYAGTVGTQTAESLLGSTPHWRATATMSYANGPFTGFVQGRYVGGGKYSTAFTAADINDNKVSGQTLFDLSSEYRVTVGGTQLALFGVVNNVFDKDPPVDPGVFVFATATNPSLYDVFGRTFKVGVRVKM